MTKKDYIKIASIIQNNTNKVYESDNIKLDMSNTLNKRGVIGELCIAFKEDNNFDENEFINACYFDDKE